MGLTKTWRSVRKRLKLFRAPPDAEADRALLGAVQEQLAGQQDLIEEQLANIEADRALRAALQEQLAGRQDLIEEQLARIAELETLLRALESEKEQLAGRHDLIEEQLARIAELETLLKAAESEKEKAQQQIGELEFRIELSRVELVRCKGQIDFVRDLMLQQVRL